MQCGVCDGELQFLGQMGQKIWFRCRACGMDQSDDADNWVIVRDEDGEIRW